MIQIRWSKSRVRKKRKVRVSCIKSEMSTAYLGCWCVVGVIVMPHNSKKHRQKIGKVHNSTIKMEKEQLPEVESSIPQ